MHFYGIDIETDNPLTHSTKICELCYRHFRRYLKEQSIPQHLLTTFSDRVTSSRFLWQIFDEMLMRTVVQFVLTARNRIRVAGQKRLKKEKRRDLYKLMEALQTQTVLSFNPMCVLHFRGHSSQVEF